MNAAPQKSSESEGVSGSLVAQMIAAISGLLVGLLCRGFFAMAAIVLATALIFAFAGWWARGLKTD
ncbi:hypothetical protein G6L32_14860 [Agrobacterium tumefaciens]|uniref:hypothetical protein n=1 Tax=Agrobacterium tumefaciens TaxID=358 RepID=UPI0015728E7F|nr:hypothetical protein [Agrobacterium tumefaciens]